MEIAEILIHDSAHPLTRLVLVASLGIAIVCIISRFIPKRTKRADEIAAPITHFITFTAVTSAALSGLCAITQAQYDRVAKSRVDASTIAKTLQARYSVTRIDGGDPATGSFLDPDDVSNNTYTAKEITISDRTYQDCQAILSPSTEHDKKTYTTIKLTCHDQTEPKKPITLTPHE